MGTITLYLPSGVQEKLVLEAAKHKDLTATKLAAALIEQGLDQVAGDEDNIQVSIDRFTDIAATKNYTLPPTMYRFWMDKIARLKPLATPMQRQAIVALEERIKEAQS